MEDRNMNRRRKRIMEANSTKCNNNDDNNNGGEVRRLHIIYFLSRMGHIEHPHLLRIFHLTRNGVYLRDVKRWLSEARGKDMPESFAWSYKRRYKSGYVWQDLLDDDLITPISDNEYVLKGSEYPSCSEKKTSEEIHRHSHSDPKIDTRTKKISSEICIESPVFGFGSEKSILTENEEIEYTATFKQNTNEQTDKKSGNDSFSAIDSSLLNNKKTNNNINNNDDNTKNIIENTANRPDSSFSSSSTSSSSSSPSSSSKSSPFVKKSKSYSSNMFRNWIRCGAADTNDTVLVSLNRSEKNCSTNKLDSSAAISRDRKLGGSARTFGTPWNNQQHCSYRKSFDGVKASKEKHEEFTNPKRSVSAAYKPVAGPSCSHCGKSFKPEKMYSHMKFCKGMKAFAKTGAVSVKKKETNTPPRRSANLSHKESKSGYFLTS